MFDVANLEIELEAPMALVPAQRDPELIGGNASIMRSEVTFWSD